MAFAVSARLRRDETVDTFAAVLEIEGEKLDVWVKRPRPEYADNTELGKALVEWGESQVDFDHENVIPVLEAGRSEQGAYVIQERVDGVPLGAVLAILRRKKRALSPTHALTVAARLCDGAAYLCDALPPGHGALGPAHLYLGYQGEVCIADPQLNRLLTPVGKDLFEVKTQPYLPPEIKKGGSRSPQGDVYAMALIVLEMAIGHPVWTGARMTVHDALEALTDFTQLGQASPDLARELRKVLAPCVSPNPSVRPSHPRQVSDEMQSLLSKFNVVSDDLALGTFVESILPPGDGEEAPTMMVDPAEVERLAKARENNADWDVASVLINPEIERRAAEFVAGRRAPSAAERRNSSVTPPSPTPEQSSESTDEPSNEFFAASVDLSSASPQSLQKAARAAAKSKEQEVPPKATGSKEAPGPMAPSIRRDRAKAAVDVSKKAARAEQQNVSQRRWIMGAAVVLALAFVAAIVLLVRTGNEPPPQIRLLATSIPSGASLFVGGEAFGRTPVDIDVALQSEPYQLRFELDGHEAHEVSIGTRESELRYEARLISVGQ